MVLYRIYSQEHRIHYLAHPCSYAVLFQLICLIFTFLPPLFTGYFTGGFYNKELTYTEQPQVSFDNQYHIIFESLNSFKYSSTDLRLNNAFMASYFSSNARVTNVKDSNNDGSIDQIEININASIPSSIKDQTLRIYLIFAYVLNRYPSINMTALGYISLKVPVEVSPQSALTIYGQLNFVQHQAIRPYESNPSLRDRIIDLSSNNVQPSFDDVLTSYTNRKYLTVFQSHYTRWARLADTSAGNQLQIRIVVNVGQTTIRYVPSFWQEFRWSWIQYLAGLIPFFYVANKVKEFVFSASVVRTVVVKAP